MNKRGESLSSPAWPPPPPTPHKLARREVLMAHSREHATCQAVTVGQISCLAVGQGERSRDNIWLHQAPAMAQSLGFDGLKAKARDWNVQQRSQTQSRGARASAR